MDLVRVIESSVSPKVKTIESFCNSQSLSTENEVKAIVSTLVDLVSLPCAYQAMAARKVRSFFVEDEMLKGHIADTMTFLQNSIHACRPIDEQLHHCKSHEVKRLFCEVKSKIGAKRFTRATFGNHLIVRSWDKVGSCRETGVHELTLAAKSGCLIALRDLAALVSQNQCPENAWRQFGSSYDEAKSNILYAAIELQVSEPYYFHYCLGLMCSEGRVPEEIWSTYCKKEGASTHQAAVILMHQCYLALKSSEVGRKLVELMSDEATVIPQSVWGQYSTVSKEDAVLRLRAQTQFY